MNIFTVIFYQPIFNLLIYIYNHVPGQDMGVAIVLLTLIIRLILYPFSRSSIKSQKALATLQPEIEKLKEKYKDQREKIGPELMALYKAHKVNPFSSCLPTLIQLPFLFAIYRVFYNGLTKDGAMESLYSFVSNPGALNIMAFGFLDLSARNIWIALLAGVAQFWQAKMLAVKRQGNANMAANMTTQMMYIMPVITVVIGATFPAGLTLYWLVTTLFSIAQQYIVLRKKTEPTVVQ